MPIQLPQYETNQTTVTASTDPVLAWRTAPQDYDGIVQRCYVTQNATSTIPIGMPLFRVNATTAVPTSGDVIALEPFLTASAVGSLVYGFAQQTLSGNAMGWVGLAGHAVVRVNGTGASASISAGQPIVFNSASGFVVSGAVGAIPTTTSAQTITLSTAATYTQLETISTGAATNAATVTLGVVSATLAQTISGYPPLWGRVAATAKTHGASVVTINSASTDTATVEACLCRSVWPGGY